MPHRVGLAAGFDKNARAVDALLALGFAAVEIGTVTPRPQVGNPKPRLFRLAPDAALINRLGFNNEGVEAVADRLARRRRAGIVGANIGMNRETTEPVADYLACLERLFGLVDYFTVNVSSPNTPGLRSLQEADRLRALVLPLAERRYSLSQSGTVPPLFLKIAPDLEPAAEEAIAGVAREARLDGLVVANTTVARPAGLRSSHAQETGGLSGRPLFVPSTSLLRRMRALLPPGVALIGVGGVMSVEDFRAKRAAGADLVQLYTGFILRGPNLLRRLLEAQADHAPSLTGGS